MRFTAVIFGLVFAISCGSTNKPAADSGFPETYVAPDTTPTAPPAGLVCPMTPPCGGDPVGVWRIGSICYSDSLLEESFGLGEVARCNMHIGIVYDGTGTFTFTSDGRHSTDFSGTASEEVSMTEECMRSAKYATIFDKGANCVSSGGMRTCTINSSDDGDSEGEVSSETGSYTIGKSYLMTMMAKDGDSTFSVSDTILFNSPRNHQRVNMMGYCVSGDTLTISEEGMMFATFTKIPGALPASVPIQLPPSSSAPVPAPVSVAPTHETEPSCGGNLLGTWKFTGISVSAGLQRDLITKVRNFDPDGECAYKIGITEEGTATFGELNIRTGKCDVIEEPTLTIVYSSACLGAKPKTCDQLSAAHQAEAVSYDPKSTAVCTVNETGDCSCKHTRKYSVDNCEYGIELGINDYYNLGPAKATYAEFLSSSSSMVSYCVSGNTLKVLSRDFAIYGLDGTATVTAERVNGGPPVSSTAVELGTPGICPTVTKCGGKIAGSWDVTAVCLSPKAFKFTDPNISWASSKFSDGTRFWSCVKSMDVKGTGKAEFAESGSFSMSLAIKSTAGIDEKCLIKEERPACGAALEQFLSFAYPGVSCVSDTKGMCNCTFVTRYADIGKAITTANSYGGVQTYKEMPDGSLEISSQYESKSVTADFVSKLVDQSHPTDFGTLKVQLTDVGAYYCVQGDTLALYAGQLVNDMYLDLSAKRIK